MRLQRPSTAVLLLSLLALFNTASSLVSEAPGAERIIIGTPAGACSNFPQSLPFAKDFIETRDSKPIRFKCSLRSPSKH